MEASNSSTTQSTKRIAFIDLTRAWAILMMVQGHTIHSLIGDQYRDKTNFLYSIWEANRGLTAPLFLFMSGCIFVFLLIKSDKPEGNIRAKKGIRRAGLLLFLAYLLQFNPGIFKGFPPLNYEQYGFVIGTHILHCISIGLLILIGIFYLSKLLKIDTLYPLIALLITETIFYPYSLNISWDENMSILLANYFTHDFGSLFPIIPWHIYLLFGGILGNLLTKMQKLHMQKRFALTMITVGISGALLLPPILKLIDINISIKVIESYAYNGIIRKLFLVFAITGIFAFMCIYIKKIPKWIMVIGQNTLWIYTLHIFVVYDTYLTKSIFHWCRHSLPFSSAAFCGASAVVITISLLFFLRYIMKKIGLKFGPK
jgi:uncharacterized membrane protein